MIANPVNGEILCARINVMDAMADELLGTYFLQCGWLDGESGRIFIAWGYGKMC